MQPNNSITLIVGKTNVKFTKNEQELFDIFLEEYNDIFPNILNLSEKAIFDRIILNVSTLLGQQNYNSYSKITIAKIQSTLKSQYYMKDLISIKQIRNIFISMNSKNELNKFPPLEKKEIIPHCDKTSKCYHICGNELLYPEKLNYIICLHCKLIFKPEQIHLLCKECNEDYFADIYIEEEKHGDYIRVTWDKYHCKNFFPEDMRCPNCDEGIFFSKKRKMYKCFNCNWENSLKNMIWKCKVCGKDFYSGVTSYIKFENKPNKISYIKTLIDKIPAKPLYVPCCKYDPRNTDFIHSIDCDGILYLGINQDKKIIICSKCKNIFDYDKMNWYCSRCGDNFKSNYKKVRDMSESHSHRDGKIQVNTNYINPNDYRIIEFDSIKKHIKFDSDIPMSENRKFNSGIIKHFNSVKSVDKNDKNYINDKKLITVHKKNLSNFILQDFKSNQIEYNNSLSNRNYHHTDSGHVNKYHHNQNEYLHSNGNYSQNHNEINHSNISHHHNNSQYFSSNKNYNQNHTKENFKTHIRKYPSSNIFDDVKKNFNFNLNVNININNIYKNNIDNQTKNNKYKTENIIKQIKTLIEPNEDFNHEDFKRNKLIGEGTFGKIYSTTWNKNGLQYALKELITHSKEEINQIRVEYDLMLNFYKKTKCSGVIKVFGAQSKKEKDGNFHFYVLMELATIDWEKEIKRRGKKKNFYTEGELLSISKRLIRTFSQLQKNGISHRDIKPQNVLLIDNDYKICDFGEANIINNNKSEIHTLRGTELYMSPILFKALKLKKNDVCHNTFKSDVFSLGMCITLGASLNFKTLCEIREANDMEKVKNVLVKYLIAKYSYEFINILLMMLEIDENKRPDFIQLDDKIRD